MKIFLDSNDFIFMQLYKQHFIRLKAILLKRYYLSHYQHVIEIDDVEQILFLSFHKLYNLYKEQKPNKIQEYCFFNDILKEAGWNLIDLYRSYLTNKRKVWLKSEQLNEKSSFLINKKYYENYENIMINQLINDENIKEKLFVIIYFYKSLKDNDINKKILAYKLCFDYDNDLICKILNLPKNVYKEKWRYLKKRIYTFYETNKQKLLKTRIYLI